MIREMDKRYALTTDIASTQFGAVSIPQLDKIKVDAQVRYDWVQRGLHPESVPPGCRSASSTP